MKYCPDCGNRVEELTKFCPNCGHTLIARAEASVPEATKEHRSNLTIQQAEPTYYSDERGVRITPTRLMNGTSTYSMANIASFRTNVKPANRIPGVILAIFGIATLLYSSSQGGSAGIMGVEALLLILGIVCVSLSKSTYSIRISSSSTETDVISSKNKEYIAQISRALNEALIKRG